jgi:hypothetical protein
VEGKQVNIMKREDLKKLLGETATDELVDKIMGMNGQDIEAHKTKLTDLQTQFDAAQTQLTEANTAIEGFKKLKPEELQAAADDYKAKWEQAQKDSADQLKQIKFDHALESALAGAKVKNPKTITPLLSMDSLRDAKGELVAERLTEQLTKIKSENEYLFESEKKDAKLVLGGNNKSVLTDPFEAGLLKGAKLTPPEEGK